MWNRGTSVKGITAVGRFCDNGIVVVTDLGTALRRVPILAALPRPLLDELGQLCAVRTLAKAELVFAEGDVAGFLPILLTGRVKLYRSDPDGREQVLHLVRAPASFAEAAVFGPGIFPAAAQAVEPGQLATVPRPELLALLGRRPEVALALLASMSMWLRRLVDLVEGLSLHSVEERVGAYLWSAFVRSGQPLLAGARVRLEEAKYLIAAVCGTAPEVLSRTFRKLEAEGIVKVDGPFAVLLDPVRLAALSHGG
ncbi:MAG: Crp/Fnr family transcriptional regulator [Acidobacteriota bacterium]